MQEPTQTLKETRYSFAHDTYFGSTTTATTATTTTTTTTTTEYYYHHHCCCAATARQYLTSLAFVSSTKHIFVRTIRPSNGRQYSPAKCRLVDAIQIQVHMQLDGAKGVHHGMCCKCNGLIPDENVPVHSLLSTTSSASTDMSGISPIYVLCTVCNTEHYIL